MNSFRFSAVLLVLVASSAQAAPPPAYTVLDNSSGALMDQSTAESLWKEKASAKLIRLYPIKKWGFVTEVEGGFDDAKVCIITARANTATPPLKSIAPRP